MPSFHALWTRTAFLLLCPILAATAVAGPFDKPPCVTEFLTEQPSLSRVGRELTVLAVVENPAEEAVTVAPRLVVPDGIEIMSPAAPSPIAPGKNAAFRWTVTANKPGYFDLKLTLSVDDSVCAMESLPVRFLAKRDVTPGAIPAPKRPNKTSKMLVGAHNCPLWTDDAGTKWDQLRKHPERTPALGFYAQNSPEVADWETKWAVEHGVDFFIYCWYRVSQGGPVATKYADAIHDALYHSQFRNEIKFTIMWENQRRGYAGVSDENDLMKNLLPYWIENYFKKDNYLKIDNKPLLFIYRPEFLVTDLGSVANVRRAFDKMRAAAKAAGFDGLYILGEYRGTNPEHLTQMRELGLDYSFAYCHPVPNSPLPSEAIEQQLQALQVVADLDIIPAIVTVSQAWSGWHDEGSIWKIPPDRFEILLRRAKAMIGKLPADRLDSKMIILDNWNEWSEGHYLLPYTEYGFEYLDAIARVFTEPCADHEDLLPGDLARGPYDTPYRKWRETLRKPFALPQAWNAANDFGQWQAMMGVEKCERANGLLKTVSTTSDPALAFRFPRLAARGEIRNIRVRMKVDGLDGKKTSAQFLWITDPSEDWSEKKAMSLPIVDNGRFNDYIFPVALSRFWMSSLAGFRFDFATCRGVSVEIKEIALLK